MKTISIALVLASSFLLAFAPVSNAAACNGNITSIADTVYVDDRNINVGGVWVYVESNGVAGLQSGGLHPILGAADADPCIGGPVPDTLII